MAGNFIKKLQKATPRNVLDYLLVRLYARIWKPEKLADYLYRKELGHRINWDFPEDLNQWINKLSFRSDTHQWSSLADKYAVRDYVKEKGLEDILVPLLGVWDSPEDIDFSSLPDSFVLKSNNGCGDCMIVEDKRDVKIKSVKRYFRHILSTPFGLYSAEPHYMQIPTKIIAEELLDKSKQNSVSTSLIDYKFFCINGEPEFILVISDRKGENYGMSGFDCEWHSKNECLLPTEHGTISNRVMNRPENFTKMLEYARILSAGFPQVRVDLYEVGGKVYFGELTFTSKCGRMDYLSPALLQRLGSLISE